MCPELFCSLYNGIKKYSQAISFREFTSLQEKAPTNLKISLMYKVEPSFRKMKA